MKRVALVFLAILVSTVLLYAGDEGKAKEMSGWICNSKCVVQNGDKASCNQNCTEKGSDSVFIDEQGKVSKIQNQDKVKGHSGKKIKMKATMDEDKDMMYVYEIAETKS